MTYLTVESGSWSPTLTLARLRWANRTHPGVGKSPWHTSAMLIVVWLSLLAEILAGLPAALVVGRPRQPAHDDTALEETLILVDGGGTTNGRPSLSKKEIIADKNRTALAFAMVGARMVLLGWSCFTVLLAARIRVQSRANCNCCTKTEHTNCCAHCGHPALSLSSDIRHETFVSCFMVSNQPIKVIQNSF